MKGKYSGQYKYSGRVPVQLKDLQVEFELTIQEFDYPNFSGSVQDFAGGTQGIGEISGEIKDGQIKFVKRMPISTIIFQDGERLEERKPHRPIYYKGTLDKETNEFNGTWRFKRKIGFLEGKLVYFPGTKGVWKMKKVH